MTPVMATTVAGRRIICADLVARMDRISVGLRPSNLSEEDWRRALLRAAFWMAGLRQPRPPRARIRRMHLAYTRRWRARRRR